MKKVLITGAGGFLGSYLKDFFSCYDVTALTSAELDMSNSSAVTDHLAHTKYDVIVNCAAKGRYNARAVDTSISDANIRMFMNLLANKNNFDKLINIGTGAEFGLSSNINKAKEQDIWNVLPAESYGFSKNTISRISSGVDNFYTVRLFGCFDPTEPPGRLLSGFIDSYKTKDVVEITNDRYADYVSVSDFAKTIQLIIDNVISHRDVNVVYKEKYKLSELFRKYCDIHNLDSSKIYVVSTTENNYTGDGTVLEQYQFLEGMDRSLEKYKYE